MLPAVSILPAASPDDLRAFESLCREYESSLPYSLCFQNFDDEMRTLPGRYAPPRGVILLARSVGDIIGCVALREITPLPGDAAPVCEMKRMYVRPPFRGRGVGRLLAETLLDYARRTGYRTMKLDTEDSFVTAMALYRSLGFVETARYNDDPIPHTRWFMLRLATP